MKHPNVICRLWRKKVYIYLRDRFYFFYEGPREGPVDDHWACAVEIFYLTVIGVDLYGSFLLKENESRVLPLYSFYLTLIEFRERDP